MRRSIFIKDFIVVSCLFFAALVSCYAKYNFYALYVALPIAFLLTAFTKRFAINRPLKWLIVLYIWIILTCVTAYDISLSLRQLKQMLGAFVLSYTVGMSVEKKRVIPWLFLTYVIIFFASSYYGYTHIVDTSFDVTDTRLDDEVLNANVLAYEFVYAIMAVYVLGDAVTNPRIQQFFRFFFWLLLPIGFIVALLTASRQVIITSLPLFILLVITRYIMGAKIKKLIKILLVISIIGIFLTPRVIRVYNNSYLKQRTEYDVKDDPRTLLLKDAFQVGLEHPYTGVGPGNYIEFSYSHHFSHCTYTELFANTGILGAVIYILMIFVFLKEQYGSYKKTRDPVFLSTFFWGVIYVVYNFFYVFYFELWLISFFILVWSYSISYYRDNYAIVCSSGRRPASSPA